MRFVARLLGSNVAVFVIAVLAIGAVTRGRPVIAIDTALYIHVSDTMLRGDLTEIFTPKGARWTKGVFLLAMAIARAVSPKHWTYLLLTVNIIAAALTTTLLIDLVRRTTRSTLVGGAALLLYLTSFDMQVWVSRMLTDTLYTLFAFIPFYLVCRGLLGDAPARSHRFLVIAIALAMLSRPPGLVLIPLVIFALLVLPPGQSANRRRWAICISVVLTIATLVVRTWVVQDPERWPFSFVREKIREFSHREKRGEVIYDRREADRPMPSSFGDHLLMQGDRFVRFFQIVSPTFSRAHNLVSLASFGTMFLLGIAAIVCSLRNNDPPRRAAALAAVLWILTFAFFHAITILDFDWRFRAPLIAHFVFLAACGLDHLARRGARV
jgi:4-amino-4-deoxy-L-arabinose transferase-like glycosyltransferase